MASVKEIADEVREQNRLFESGDTDKAFWLGQQNRLNAMKALDEDLTQAQIGKLVGKKQQWVGAVLRWDYRRGSNPFARPDNPSKQGIAPAKRALQSRNQRKEVIDSLTDDEKVALIEAAAKEPEVIEKVMAKNTKASKAIRKVTVNVEEREAKERFQKNREAAAQRAQPTNLATWFHRIRIKIRDWSQDLDAIRSNIDDLHPDQVPFMIESHEMLIASAQRNIRLLKGADAAQDDGVIEVQGQVIDIRKELGA